MTPPRTLLFTANSPGEIAGWLRPLVVQARQRWPETRIVVVLLPCTFASGSEGRVAVDLVGVDEVIPASRFTRLLLSDGRRFGPSVLFHLGGDLMYAAALVWRWRYTAWAYLWGRWWWDRLFQGYFVKDERGIAWLLKRRIARAKAHVVGDLVADAVDAALAGQPRREGRWVSFLPGSRDHEVAALAPFFLEIAERLSAGRPDLRFQILVSPFLEPERVAAALQAVPEPRVGGVRGRLVDGALVGPGGVPVEVVREGNLAALAGSELALTIPGTKTAEAGCLGVPLLVFLPLNVPEKLPFVGLLGLLDWVPGGDRLKGRLLLRMKESVGLLAQPNLLAGEAVVPEVVDVVTTEDLAARAARMLDDPDGLRRTSARLQDLYRPSHGAARRIFDGMEGARRPDANLPEGGRNR